MTISQQAPVGSPIGRGWPWRRGRVRRRVPRVLVSPAGYLFATPALLIFGAFTIGPAVYMFYLSLFNWNALNPSRSHYRGLRNYQELFTEHDFPGSALNSLYFTAAMVLGGTALSLMIALLLQRGGHWFAATRVAVFTPYVTPLVATSIAWIWLLNEKFGLVNLVLHALWLPGANWLLSARFAMPSVIAYSLWHEIGFTTVVFLGGLSVLSPELGEAARVDGVNRWQEFWYITWPQLRGVTIVVITITTISSLQAFTQFYAMTQGGPGTATTTVSVLLYEQITTRTGYGASIAVVLFVVTVALTLIQRKITRPSALGS